MTGDYSHTPSQVEDDIQSMQTVIPSPEELAELRRLAALVSQQAALLREKDAIIEKMLQEKNAVIQGRQVKLLAKRAMQTCAAEYQCMKHLYSMQ